MLQQWQTTLCRWSHLQHQTPSQHQSLRGPCTQALLSSQPHHSAPTSTSPRHSPAAQMSSHQHHPASTTPLRLRLSRCWRATLGARSPSAAARASRQCMPSAWAAPCTWHQSCGRVVGLWGWPSTCGRVASCCTSCCQGAILSGPRPPTRSTTAWSCTRWCAVCHPTPSSCTASPGRTCPSHASSSSWPCWRGTRASASRRSRRCRAPGCGSSWGSAPRPPRASTPTPAWAAWTRRLSRGCSSPGTPCTRCLPTV
mmetsp:Transcript_4220/g.10547  ORF Transcript_4220/g.10547 Transcript_4220/m.10547 type:complete len:255 (+) Transcript_4220:1343-2107(+)